MREITKVTSLIQGLSLERAQAVASENGYTIRATEMSDNGSDYLITADYDERRINVITHAGVVITVESLG